MHDRAASNYGRTSESRNQDQRYGDDRRGGPRDAPRRSSFNDHEGHSSRAYRGDRPDDVIDRRGSQRDYNDRRPGIGNESDRRGERQPDFDERRGNNRNWDERNSIRSNRDYDPNMRGAGGIDRRRGDDRDARSSMTRPDRNSSYYSDDRRNVLDSRGDSARSSRGPPTGRDMRFSDRNSDRGSRVGPIGRQSTASNAYVKIETTEYGGGRQQGPSDLSADFRATRSDPEVQGSYKEETESPTSASKKRPYEPPPSRGYDIEPVYAKRRTSL